MYVPSCSLYNICPPHQSDFQVNRRTATSRVHFALDTQREISYAQTLKTLVFISIYDDVAQRELRKKPGIEADPADLGKIPASATTDWDFVKDYRCLPESFFTPHFSETAELRWIDPVEAIDRPVFDVKMVTE